MFDITPWNDMWRQMDALMQYPFNNRTFEKTGLKALISRPHNIVNVRDENGKIVAQRLEVVTTPFAKDDVKVSVKGNVLTVLCGWSKPECEMPDKSESDNYIYKGISTQSYEFSLKLGDNIDKNAIEATNVDGVLKVTLPFVKEEEKKEETVLIDVK